MDQNAPASGEPSDVERALERQILTLLAERAEGRTICPPRPPVPSMQSCTRKRVRTLQRAGGS